MVDVTCPWCEQDVALSLSTMREPQVSFTCLECGTSVDWVDEPVAEFELAA